MKKMPAQIAIIGPTASGKSALAVSVAKKWNAVILSLDSLSIYKEIDIVSAKPTPDERDAIEHFGVDEIYPNEQFDVTIFASLYKRVYDLAQDASKNLVIVGGTGFYLKALMDGISALPALTEAAQEEVAKAMRDMKSAYAMMYEKDPLYMQKIAPNDRYRIEKALEIYYASGKTPTSYFACNPPVATIKNRVTLYEIETKKEILRERITKRTASMLRNGLIDEVADLEMRYSRTPHCMRAVGIQETLDFLDGIYTKRRLEEKICTNTARLAKRQTTFNRSQFSGQATLEIEDLEKKIYKDLGV